MKTSLFLFLSLMAFHVTEARDFRDLTNKDGVKITAEVLELEEGKLRIRTKGRVFKIEVSSLSEADQAWIAEWDAKRSGTEDDIYYSEVMFEDDFSGEGFGERWGHYKSESVVKDGIMIGKTIDIKVHAGCDSVRFEGQQDMEVAVKFNFAGSEADRFNVWFDDKDYKDSHAGHICSVTITPKYGTISDAKTGNFDNAIYEKRKSPEGLNEEEKKDLATKMTRFDLDLDREEWHELLIRTKGNSIVVKIGGKVVGEFESEGVGHLTKSLVSLTTNVNDVHYDDFSVKAAKASKKK